MTIWHEDLRRNGFTKVEKLLPRDAIIAATESIRRTVADQLAILKQETPADLHDALRVLHGADIDRYKRTLGALWRKADINALMKHPQIMSFVRENFGWNDIFLPGGDVLFVVSDDLKIPGGYFGLGAHQDFPSVQGSLDGIVVWIPITDAGCENFPLEVIRGSHRLGLMKDVEETQNGWQIQPENQPGAFEALEAQAGDVLFMSYFTIHRTGLNGHGLRIALSTRFDNASEPTYVARTYPTAYLRSVHREQYIADFPTLDALAEIWD